MAGRAGARGRTRRARRPRHPLRNRPGTHQQSSGKAEPAAAVIRRLFQTGEVSADFNGDFSQAVATPEGNLPAVWRLWEPDQAHFALDSSVGHDTPGSARISDSLDVDGGVPALYTVPVQPQAVPGGQYRVTAWVRGQEAPGTAPPGSAFAEIWLKSADNSGTVWFDDVTWTR